MEVSIIGSGAMATGIAQVFCLNSSVVKVNIIARNIDKAMQSKALCNKNISRLVEKKK